MPIWAVSRVSQEPNKLVEAPIRHPGPEANCGEQLGSMQVDLSAAALHSIEGLSGPNLSSMSPGQIPADLEAQMRACSM